MAYAQAWQNSRLPKMFHMVMQILGWATIAAVILRILQGWPLVSDSTTVECREYLRVTWVSRTVLVFMTAVVALGVGQFVRYFCDGTYKGGRILRNGHKILYAQACLVAGHYLLEKFLMLRMYAGDHGVWSFFQGDGWTRFAAPALQLAICIAILLGGGFFLRSVLSVIDELRMAGKAGNAAP